MYSVMTEPHARARHATEYQRLKVWFARRLHELGLDEVAPHDPLDPFHPYNQAFDPLIKEAERLWRQNHQYWPSPLQLTHAFFQMSDPIKAEHLTS